MHGGKFVKVFVWCDVTAPPASAKSLRVIIMYPFDEMHYMLCIMFDAFSWNLHQPNWNSFWLQIVYFTFLHSVWHNALIYKFVRHIYVNMIRKDYDYDY